MTMREKLIGAAESVAVVGGEDRDGFQRVKNWPAVIDAILTTLREPDEEMKRAAFKDAFEKYAHLTGADGTQVISQEDGIVMELECESFTAMIDHIRSGK